jgi:hypothetical protein
MRLMRLMRRRRRSATLDGRGGSQYGQIGSSSKQRLGNEPGVDHVPLASDRVSQTLDQVIHRCRPTHGIPPALSPANHRRSQRRRPAIISMRKSKRVRRTVCFEELDERKALLLTVHAPAEHLKHETTPPKESDYVVPAPRRLRWQLGRLAFGILPER